MSNERCYICQGPARKEYDYAKVWVCGKHRGPKYAPIVALEGVGAAHWERMKLGVK